MKEKVLIQEIEKYLTFLKKMSQDDLSSLLKKEKEIVFEIRDKNSKLKSIEPFLGDEEIEKIISKLGSVEKREDGINFIETLNLTRSNLENILKKLDILFTKKDSISRLKEKLIESTIGFKLRSEAIQKNI